MPGSRNLECIRAAVLRTATPLEELAPESSPPNAEWRRSNRGKLETYGRGWCRFPTESVERRSLAVPILECAEDGQHAREAGRTTRDHRLLVGRRRPTFSMRALRGRGNVLATVEAEGGAPGRSRACDPRIRSSQPGRSSTHMFLDTCCLEKQAAQMRRSAVDCERLQLLGDTQSDT